MRSSRLRCVRPGLALAVACLSGLGLAAGGASAVAASDSTAMRVLLYRGPGPVTIEAGGHSASFEASDEGVRRDGREVRDRWEIPARRGADVAGRRVKGELRVAVDASAKGRTPGLVVVNTVELEDYVAGVLDGEIPASWSAEALAAQAVASRSYALHQRAVHSDAAWHVSATTSHQVYADSASVHEAIRRAVEQTRGEVLTYRGQPILAAFHSASGGRTASADEVWGRPLPYLVSRDVMGEEDSPDTYWRAGLSLETFGRLLDSAGVGVGRPHSVEIVERSESGRVARLEVRGSKGQSRLSGRELRSIVGEATLRSTLFDVRPETGRVVFVGTGRGHGVGMSQWGAQALAREGRRYPEILEVFYPGTRLEDLKRTVARRP
jgi:stage II sporulation protein D